MKPIYILLLPAIGTVFSLLNANAAVVFDASTTNSGIVDNNVNQTSNAVTGTTGALVVTTITTGNNHASGLASIDDINTLKGSALVATDTVTMKLVVTGSTLNNIRANGFEFGMSPAAPVVGDDSDISDFRPASNLIFQIDADNDASGMAIGNIPGLTLNAAGWAVTEASLGDGFTISLIANSSGFTFNLFDIVDTIDAGITTRSFGGTFTGSQFVDNFETGHIYYTRQLATGTGEINISEYSIDVTSVPEPSTALLGLFGFAGLLRRRR